MTMDVPILLQILPKLSSLSFLEHHPNTHPRILAAADFSPTADGIV